MGEERGQGYNKEDFSNMFKDLKDNDNLIKPKRIALNKNDTP